MGATIALILQLSATIVEDAPEVLEIVSTAIAAFNSSDQASLDAAHQQAIDLANSLAPKE